MKADWQAYYKEFSILHEGEPVVWSKDKYAEPRHKFLLFRDGWMYSAGDPSGPEYPPPIDPKNHLRLIKIYWMMRIRVVKEELAKLKDEIRRWIATQHHYSAPIQTASFVFTRDDDDRIKRNKIVGPIDFEFLLSKAGDLHNDLLYCQKELNNIKLPEPIESKQFPEITPAAILSQIEEIESDERI